MLLHLLSDSICLLMLSEIIFSRLISLQNHFVPSLSPQPCVCVCVCCDFSLPPFMPPLKETYLQIQERNKREIRHRTNVRLAQLQLEQDNRQGSAIDEQEQESDSLSPSRRIGKTCAIQQGRLCYNKLYCIKEEVHCQIFLRQIKSFEPSNNPCCVRKCPFA
jgi:hypothetical protein